MSKYIITINHISEPFEAIDEDEAIFKYLENIELETQETLGSFLTGISKAELDTIEAYPV